jgi:regulator of sirC expression with transglutaminase-like and TPR domain
VGGRAGLNIHACNWPRHFLARFRDEAGRLFIVDPANEGAVVDGETFLSMQGTSREAAEAVLTFEVDAATIVTRILGNLVRAYRNEDDEDNCLLAVDLLRDMESRLITGALC